MAELVVPRRVVRGPVPDAVGVIGGLCRGSAALKKGEDGLRETRGDGWPSA